MSNNTAPPQTLVDSSFLSSESLAALDAHADSWKDQIAQIQQAGPLLEAASKEEVPAVRERYRDVFYASALYKRLTQRYAVEIDTQTIAGVYCEVFTPKEGVSAENHDRVLINFHGGGFISGSRTSSHQESIPIASLGKIKVVSVDYRMAPEHQFPAASDDAMAVYKTLLKQYKPENIGIYGHSAGAILTSQLIAGVIQAGLPLPAAIGLHCAAPHYWRAGDSGQLDKLVNGTPVGSLEEDAFFSAADPESPSVFPAKSENLLRQFPPTLLISATRDFILSSVVHTHCQLTKLDVDADLHVWEGLGHAFILNTGLPEAREAYQVVVKFFEQQFKQASARNG